MREQLEFDPVSTAQAMRSYAPMAITARGHSRQRVFVLFADRLASTGGRLRPRVVAIENESWFGRGAGIPLAAMAST